MTDTDFATPIEQDEASVFDSIPGIVFDNRTKFAAIHFNTVDQHDQAFHVFVLKQAFDIGAADASGMSPLRPSPRKAVLEYEDRYFDGDSEGSVEYESDLAPFKPKCDILVKGSAYAPGRKPVPQLTARVKLQRASEVLIDKSLILLGEHVYKRSAGKTALIMARASSLGLIRGNPWTTTEPVPFTSLPIRYEFSVGGAARVAKTEPAAVGVPKEVRIVAVDGDDEAHQVCETNPLGRGYAPLWYLTATGKSEMAAPRIVYPGQSLSADQFWEAANGSELPPAAGFGVVGRAWLPRRKLAGNFVDKSAWCEHEVPRLPEDFDYGYWNCAPEDQQCSFLRYGEVFTLQNLFRPEHHSAIGTGKENIVRFVLPQQALFLLAGNADGEVHALNLHVDTVFIDTDVRRIELVWRGLLEAGGRFSEVRLMHVDDAAQIQRLDSAAAMGIFQVKRAARRKE